MISKNLKNTIDFYCENEIESLKNNPISKEILFLAKRKYYNLNIEYGRLEKQNKHDVYLSYSIVNSNDEIVEIEDDGHLCYSTKLVSIDSKNRLIFATWYEEDFIETLEWIKSKL